MEKKIISVIVDDCTSSRACSWSQFFDGSLKDAALSAADSFNRLAYCDKKCRDSVYVYSVPARRPETDEEAEHLRDLEDDGEAFEVDGWFIDTPECTAPTDYSIDSIDVVEDGKLVLAVEEDDEEEDGE